MNNFEINNTNKKNKLEEFMDKNEYTAEEKYKEMLGITEISMRRIVYESRNYLNKENLSKLEDMLTKENLNDEDLAKINKFIIDNGMPEDIIDNIIKNTIDEYSSILNQI